MIKSELIKILNSVGVAGEIMFSTPPKSEMGDLSFACFDIAKIWKISPVDAAKKIVDVIARSEATKQSQLIDKIEAIGPYVNFFLNTGTVAKIVLTDIKHVSSNYCCRRELDNKKTIIIEYPANNTHKELHVGHLRNICIGNALCKIFSAQGFRVIPINYVNDFGAHVPKCLWGLKKFHANEKPPKNKQKWLGEIYVEASRYLEAHPEEKDEVSKLLTKLEAHDRSIWPIYKKTRAWSLKGFKKIFAELHVKPKSEFYEKDTKPVGQKVVDELIQKGIATVGDGGAIIIDLTKENLDIALLRKSNGAGLYLTSDFGLTLAKKRKYPNIAENIYLTGIEQNFYFKQLFHVLQLAGFNYKMKHIGYGLVSRLEGKMSSRLGNVLLYEDLRDEVVAKMCTETKERHGDWGSRKIIKTGRALAFAAIKFEILKHEAEKNIVFDTKSVISFDGFTGPYVLYTVARINSLVKKSKLGNYQQANLNLLQEQEEKKLIMILSQWKEILLKAFVDYNPSVVVKYSFDLAKTYSEFYTKHRILNAENSEIARARLCLCVAVKQILEDALAILDIATVPEM